MAAPAADAQTVPWRVVVAAIDAMPGVPSWKEIERQVYERVEMRIRAAEGTLSDEEMSQLRRQGISAYAYKARSVLAHEYDDYDRRDVPLRDRLLDDGDVCTLWADALSELFRPILMYLREYKRARRQLEHGALTWLALRYVHTEPELVLRILGMEWRHVDNAGPDPDVYAMTLLTPQLARRLLPLQTRISHANRSGPHVDARDVIAGDHFVAALRACIMQERTDLALSGLIDRVALRQGTPMAQHLARFIAPDTVTVQRPLHIRQHASQLEEVRANMSDVDRPDAVLDRATRSSSNSTGGAVRRLARDPPPHPPPTLASILDVMCTPGQDPTTTLARASTMLDTLMQSIDDATPPALLPFSSSSSSSLPPATHW